MSGFLARHLLRGIAMRSSNSTVAPSYIWKRRFCIGPFISLPEYLVLSLRIVFTIGNHSLAAKYSKTGETVKNPKGRATNHKVSLFTETTPSSIQNLLEITGQNSHCNHSRSPTPSMPPPYSASLPPSPLPQEHRDPQTS